MKETYINEHGIKMVKMSLEDVKHPSRAQIERVKNASKNASGNDPDCPPMSEEMQRRMKKRIQDLKSAGVATT